MRKSSIFKNFWNSKNFFLSQRAETWYRGFSAMENTILKSVSLHDFWILGFRRPDARIAFYTKLLRNWSISIQLVETSRNNLKLTSKILRKNFYEASKSDNFSYLEFWPLNCRSSLLFISDPCSPLNFIPKTRKKNTKCWGH